MAQAGFTPISLYFSSTAAAVPTSGNLANGELGLNIADMKLYAKNSAGTVTLLASNASTGATVSSVAVSGGTTGLTTSGGPITTSGTVTLAGTLATANGGTGLGGATPFAGNCVVFASSASVLATSANLQFNGTRLDAVVGRFGTGATFGTESLQVSKANGTGVIGSAYQFSINSITAGNRVEMLMTDAVSANCFISYSPSGTASNDKLTINLQGSDIFNVVGNGSVGIGTSSPSYALDVFAGTMRLGSGAGSGGTMYFSRSGQSDAARVACDASSNLQFWTNTAERARIDTSGNVLVGGTAARGTTVGTGHLDLFDNTAPAGTLTNGISLYSSSGDFKFMNAAGDAFDVGYRNIPQNSQSAAYTLVLADAGKHIFHPVGDNNARTFTIPANSSVAYPVGTAITFINMAVANVTIAITTDTMYLSSAGTTGSRTLAQYGSATAIKITSTNWLISGSGLT